MEKIITKKQVINAIGAKLARQFSSEGFKYIKSKEKLIKKTREGFDEIIISANDYYPISHQILFIDFAKRINVVEDIVNKFYDKRFKNPDFDKFTTTVYLDNEVLKSIYLINFGQENYKECLICKENLKENGFVLHTEKDIDFLSNYLIIFIRDKVLPFFEINNDIKYVNKIEKERILSPQIESFPIPSLMKSLVLMKLTNDKCFNKKKEVYIKKAINPYDDFGVNKLEVTAIKELIDFLEKNDN